MILYRYFWCYFFLVTAMSCNMNNKDEQMEQWKEEIVQAERAFCALAQEEGLKKAFTTFADSTAVLMRNNEIIKGYQAIYDYMDQPTDLKDMMLIWEPEFVDVSQSGDLGYTYGPFTLSFTDVEGKRQESTGVFHTVWKRNSLGEWKYVWD